jgi:hypothetical protein
MLREHYPTDKRFEEILRYVPPLEPELVKIDTYLEDEKLFRMITSSRCPSGRRIWRSDTPRPKQQDGSQRRWR